MKPALILIGFVLLNLIHEQFPDKKNVLVKDFLEYENFLPLATLDLTEIGIEDKIHVIYVSFNYGPPVKDPNFPNNEDVDHFTFQIEKSGLYRPTFKKEAMKMDSLYKPYFNRTLEKYQKARTENFKIEKILKVSDKPDWLQNDATPVNSKGKKFTFIAQFELETFSTDDAWVYIFYDKADRQVKYVYQRT